MVNTLSHKVGILTAGHTCAGVNTAIKSLAMRELKFGNRVYGYKEGFAGLNYGMKMELSPDMLNDDAGSILHMSREDLNMNSAIHEISKLDKLYCIGGAITISRARQIALDDRVSTNVICLAKGFNNDIRGLESFGFQSTINVLKEFVNLAYMESITSKSIVVLETPEDETDNLAKHTYYRNKQKIDKVLSPGLIEDPLIADCIYKKYISNCRSALIIASRGSNYENVCKILHEKYETECKFIKPGNLIGATKPSLYDSLLCARMGEETFFHSLKNKNFIRDAGSFTPLEEYSPVVY